MLREDLLEQVREEQKSRPRKAPAPRKPARAEAPVGDAPAAPAAEDGVRAEGDAPTNPAKKRRRRRKPNAAARQAAGGEGGGGGGAPSPDA